MSQSEAAWGKLPSLLHSALDSEADVSLSTNLAPFPLVLVGVTYSLTGVVKSGDSRLGLVAEEAEAAE